MKYLRFSIRIVLISFFGFVVLLGADYWYVSSDSFGSSAWRSSLTRELEQHGSVQLADLVQFNWEKVYFLSPYELSGNPRLAAEIWGNAFWSPWWDDDERYWTIVYKKKQGPPFVVKMDAQEWALRGEKFSTADPNAKLRLIGKAQPESNKCPKEIKFCISLG